MSKPKTTNSENEAAFSEHVWSIKQLGHPILAEFNILGEPASKANSRRVAKNKSTGRMRFIKSEKALDYAEKAKAQSPCLLLTPECAVGVAILIRYSSRRPDLDESIILDAMQGRCYANDRQVERKFVVRGKENKEWPSARVVVYML